MLTNFCGSSAASLTAISNGCLQIGEVRKLIFQRKYSSGTTLNELTIASANPNLIASWTPLLTAVNGTKAIVTPFEIDNPVFEPGQVYEEGGPGETAGGIPKFVGFGPGKFTCKVTARVSKTIEELRKLYGEDLTVHLINGFGRIIMSADANSSPTKARGIDIKELKVSGRQGDAINTRGFNTLEFYLPDGWDNVLYEVTPSDFNALTGLAN